ncbi:MAG: TerB family tellurite resistance protein [Rhodospirillales bacterium]|nr:MAG: TerB family tellurite resistance protein [Rhodospirillales bacterium]
MVDFLRDFLFRRKGAAPEGASGHGEAELRLAAAALMVEAAKLDGAFEDAERGRIATILGDRFAMNADDIATLIAAADAETDLAGGLYGFTRTVRDNFDHAERVAMIEMLWDVAYADGVLHDFEANMLRRVAGLLYVTDQESGAARKRVLDRLSGEAGTAGGQGTKS